MSILLITDTQLGMAKKNLNSEKWNPIVSRWIANHEPSKKELMNLEKFQLIVDKFNPEFIVHAGDIVNEIDKEIDIKNYLNFSKNIGVKINHVPGNHDVGIDPNNLSMKGLEFYKYNFGDDFYNFNWKVFEIIFLNSSKFINYENSVLYNEQVNFIKETLKTFKSKKRIIVVMHHPPFIDKKDILNSGEKDLHGKDISYWAFEKKINDEFFNLFENHSLEYIFTGHLHINLETQFNKTKIIVTSALGVPLGNDPSGYRIIDFKNEKLSYDFYKI